MRKEKQSKNLYVNKNESLSRQCQNDPRITTFNKESGRVSNSNERIEHKYTIALL